MSRLSYILLPMVREPEMDQWYIVSRLKKAFHRHNIETKLICIDDYAYSDFVNLPNPDSAVFIHLFTYPIYRKYNDIIQSMNRWNNVLVNDCISHYSVSNKLRMYDILLRNGINIAKTFGVNEYSDLSIDECNFYFEVLKSPLVLKPAFGFKGKSAFLCYSPEDLKTNLELLRQNPFTYKSPAVIQRYVNDYKDMFVRVYVTPNNIGGYISLVSPFEEIKFNNFNKHRFRIPYKVEKKLELYVRKSLECLNINIATCDVLVDGDSFFLTDVNSIGDYKMYDVINRANFSEDVVSYMVERFHS